MSTEILRALQDANNETINRFLEKYGVNGAIEAIGQFSVPKEPDWKTQLKSAADEVFIFSRPPKCNYAKTQLIHGVWIHIDKVFRYNNEANDPGLVVVTENLGVIRRQEYPAYRAYIHNLWSELEEKAIAQLKRILREWPTCPYGGTINVAWNYRASWTRRAFFCCSKCKPW
jgi:hypothetical protein